MKKSRFLVVGLIALMLAGGLASCKKDAGCPNSGGCVGGGAGCDNNGCAANDTNDQSVKCNCE